MPRDDSSRYPAAGAGSPERLADIRIDLLTCPVCRHDSLRKDPEGERLICVSCAETYAVDDGIVDLRFAGARHRQPGTEFGGDAPPNMLGAASGKRGSANLMLGILKRRIRALRRVRGQLSVLEIGGTIADGRGFAPFMADVEEAVDCYVGVDPGPHKAPTGVGRSTRVNVLRANGEYLPVRAARFDLAVSVATFDRLFDAERCLREIRRVLKPDGLLYIQLANNGAWFRRLVRTHAAWHGVRAGAPARYFWTPGEFRALLRAARFDVVESIGFRYAPLLNGLPRAGGFGESLREAGCRVIDWMGNRIAPDRGGDFAVLCRRAGRLEAAGP